MRLADFLTTWFRRRPEEARLVDSPATDSRWWTGRVACSICEHEQVSVVEIGPDEEAPIVPLECESCGNMTGSPVR